MLGTVSYEVLGHNAGICREIPRLLGPIGRLQALPEVLVVHNSAGKTLRDVNHVPSAD